MTARVHDLKTWPESFEAMAAGHKTCELRRDDRGFAVGDELVLREWILPDPTLPLEREIAPTGYTGRELRAYVTHVQRGFGLPDGHVALSIRLIGPVLQDGWPQHAPCPFCGEVGHQFEQVTARSFCVRCDGCGARGPVGRGPDQGAARWKARALWSHRSDRSHNGGCP